MKIPSHLLAKALRRLLVLMFLVVTHYLAAILGQSWAVRWEIPTDLVDLQGTVCQPYGISQVIPDPGGEIVYVYCPQGVGFPGVKGAQP